LRKALVSAPEYIFAGGAHLSKTDVTAFPLCRPGDGAMHGFESRRIDVKNSPALQRKLRPLTQISLVLAAVGIVAAAAAVFSSGSRKGADTAANFDISSQSRGPRRAFDLTDAQWAALKIETLGERVFRSRLVTDGKIAVDEDHATPIFSPYSGRVTRLLVKPGDGIRAGQALFTIEATDTVQAQNDFMAAIAGVNKARSQLNLTQIIEKRNKDLYEGKAVALKDWQQSQADLTAAQNDMRSSESALEAVRNRLRILGRTDEEVMAFQEHGRISPETPIYAPISGTVVQRKVGPGQYVNQGASDPVFVIGDLTTVWLLANVRESDASKVRVGQPIEFEVLAYPKRKFLGTIAYVAASVDPNTRRLPVRAAIDNADLGLKPEMFASVGILFADETTSVAVPREALIYEGNTVRAWVAVADKRVELRTVTPGLINENLVQALGGLRAGEKVVIGGNIFIDRVARGGES
jgi:membrane fusion protein, heavy metal efflux system